MVKAKTYCIVRIRDEDIRNGTEGRWSGLTLDESCLGMLWPDKVALHASLASAALAKVYSTDRLDGVGMSEGTCSWIVRTGVVMGS